jgi:hypothetical protein
MRHRCALAHHLSAQSSPPSTNHDTPNNITQSTFTERNNTMQILFINNAGSGFADRIVIENNMTIRKLFEERMPGCSPGDYLIRVNRQPVESSYVIQENDRISITPTKIHGARAAA